MAVEALALKRILACVVEIAGKPHVVLRRWLRAQRPLGGREWSDAELGRLRLEGLERLNHLLSGVATTRDAEALQLWRRRSPAHEEAFRSALRLRHDVRFNVRWPDDDVSGARG